jgi:hypothetical protein
MPRKYISGQLVLQMGHAAPNPAFDNANHLPFKLLDNL